LSCDSQKKQTWLVLQLLKESIRWCLVSQTSE